MYIIATASADTYITNKIVDGSRVKDSNVGRAGTLDLFKLYDETVSGSTGGHTELSRILVKFDVSRLISLSSGSLDVGSSNFRANLRLQSVATNLPVPQNFSVSVFPLARNFNEGFGRDVSSFTDIDACNYLSSSAGVPWAISGAYSSGAVGDSNIDFYASGNLQDGNGLRSLESNQLFYAGNEDLFVDVSDIVSATIANLIPNYGFLIAFTSSQETDHTTRFVKRFASRHVTHEELRPRLEVSSNSATFDSHSSSFFDVSGSLYLTNTVGSNVSNILSASQDLTGANCLRIVLSTGSYSRVISASQQTVNGYQKAGSYFGSFYISAQDSSTVSGSVKISDHAQASGSIVFNEKWQSIDGSVTFLSTFLTCSMPERVSSGAPIRQLSVKTLNARPKYGERSSSRLRVFAYDSNYEPTAVRVPKPTRSVLPEMYYRVKDIEGNVFIPFGKDNGGTRLSFDASGLFFDLYTDGLPAGKLMTIDYLVVDRQTEYIVEDKNVKFTVGA
jgi:hypothetical protein